MARFSDLGSSTAYEVLRLPESADASMIVKAYRSRQREVHPDLGGDREESARVAIAYRWLTQQRPDYDAHLHALRSATSEAWSQSSAWDEAQDGSGTTRPGRGERETWEPAEVFDEQDARSEDGGGDPEDDLWARWQTEMDAEDRWRERLLRAAAESRRQARTGRRRWSYSAIGAVLLAFFGILVLSVPLAVWALVAMRRRPGYYRGRWLAILSLVWALGWIVYRVVMLALEPVLN